MLIDNVTIIVTAGKGGDGAVTFRREKFIPRGGPDGGNGGKGGDVYFVATTDLLALAQFRGKHEVKAANGLPGMAKKRHGGNSPDIKIFIPIGTTVTNTVTGQQMILETPGEEILMVKGGYGGKGNFELRSATNQTPREAEKGRQGQTLTLNLNLQYIADVGLVGLPNAGKSSLLNELSHAQAKVADYPFTTLEPNLGVFERLIIADIPGLIEGASKGRGLGLKFLKHIEKTRLLLHCIDATSKDCMKDYEVIRHELEQYSSEFLQKPEIILLTKKDEVDEEQLKKLMKIFKKAGKDTMAVSILDDKSIDKLKQLLLDQFPKKTTI